MEHELEIEHCRVIVNAEEGPGGGPVFAGKFAHLRQFGFEAVFVQGHNVLGGGEVRGHGIVVHLEFAGKESIEKPDIGRSEVPGEFECAPRVWVRPVTLFLNGNRFKNAASGEVFLLDLRQKNFSEERGLFRCHDGPLSDAIRQSFRNPAISRPTHTLCQQNGRTRETPLAPRVRRYEFVWRPQIRYFSGRSRSPLAARVSWLKPRPTRIGYFRQGCLTRVSNGGLVCARRRPRRGGRLGWNAGQSSRDRAWRRLRQRWNAWRR